MADTTSAPVDSVTLDTNMSYTLDDNNAAIALMALACLCFIVVIVAAVLAVSKYRKLKFDPTVNKFATDNITTSQ